VAEAPPGFRPRGETPPGFRPRSGGFIPGSDPASQRYRIAPGEPGDTPEFPINAQHPKLDAATRFKIESLAGNEPRVIQEHLESLGFETKQREGLKFSLRDRSNPTGKWYATEKEGGLPELQDISDVAGGIGTTISGIAGGATTAPLGLLAPPPLWPITVPLAAAGGAFMAGSATEAGLQEIGKNLGLRPTPKEIGAAAIGEGAAQAAGELLGPLIGRAAAPVLKGAGKALQAPKRIVERIAGKRADKADTVIRETIRKELFEDIAETGLKTERGTSASLRGLASRLEKETFETATEETTRRGFGAAAKGRGMAETTEDVGNLYAQAFAKKDVIDERAFAMKEAINELYGRRAISPRTRFVTANAIMRERSNAARKIFSDANKEAIGYYKSTGLGQEAAEEAAKKTRDKYGFKAETFTEGEVKFGAAARESRAASASQRERIENIFKEKEVFKKESPLFRRDLETVLGGIIGYSTGGLLGGLAGAGLGKLRLGTAIGRLGLGGAAAAGRGLDWLSRQSPASIIGLARGAPPRLRARLARAAQAGTAGARRIAIVALADDPEFRDWLENSLPDNRKSSPAPPPPQGLRR